MNSTAARCFSHAYANFFRCDTVSGPFTNDTRRTKKSSRYYEAICMNNISEPNCFTLRRDRKTFLFFSRSFEGTKENALEST